MCAGQTTALVSSAVVTAVVSPLAVGLSLATGLSVRSALLGSMAVSGGVSPEQLGRRSQLSSRRGPTEVTDRAAWPFLKSRHGYRVKPRLPRLTNAFLGACPDK